MNEDCLVCGFPQVVRSHLFLKDGAGPNVIANITEEFLCHDCHVWSEEVFFTPLERLSSCRSVLTGDSSLHELLDS